VRRIPSPTTDCRKAFLGMTFRIAMRAEPACIRPRSGENAPTIPRLSVGGKKRPDATLLSSVDEDRDRGPSRNQLMRKTLAIIVVLTAFRPLAAQDIDATAINRARTYLDARAKAQFVNGFVHFGTECQGHQYVRTLKVQNGGQNVPGQFAVVYDYQWTNGGQTQIAFLCDARGRVYKTQVLSTNGVLQQPFAVASASIQIVGRVVFDSFKEKLTPNDRQYLQQLIDTANSQRILEFCLQLDQP
jgi:hypothetical protein